MTSLRSFLIPLLAAAIGLTGGIGCLPRTPDSAFYSLSPVRFPEPHHQKNLTEKVGSCTLGIKRIRIPDYLKRANLVTRNANGALDIAAYDRWAGNLEENIQLVITENLQTLLPDCHVSMMGFDPPTPAAVVIAISIRRFEVVSPDQARLSAVWTQTLAGKDLPQISRSVMLIERFRDTGVTTDQVAALNRLIGQLCHRMADEISGTGREEGVDTKTP